MTLLNGVDCIIWINLDRSTDRATRMKQMFEDDSFANIPIIRFSAIDGKNPTIVTEKIEEIHHPKKILEYACLLSHIETIRYFLEKTSYNNVLILEDDATLEFKPYWTKSVKEILDNAPSGWDSVILGYMSNQLPPNTYTFNKYEYSNVKYWSTIAYVVNRKGAQKYIDAILLENGKYRI